MATTVHRPAKETRRGTRAVPRRGAGLELLGRFEGSGLKDPPYLVRRADGQVIQLTPLLYAVAEAADGTRDEREIAPAVSSRVGRPVSADNVRFLAERKLRPLGVLAGADGATPDLDKRDAPLALRHRRPLVFAPVVNRLAGGLQPLFWPTVIAVAVAALAAFDAWLFFSHGIAGALRDAIYEPALLFAVFGSVVLGTAFHELGHAAACRYGGARPGAIGGGFYLIWPAFYCDVTDAYRLPRWGRVRTDLGGVYFNAVFALAFAGLYAATRFEPLLLVVVAQHFVIVQQLLPVLRFDGYYVLSDLTGVPDILSRVGAIFRSLLPWREHEPRVAELKPWVRAVVTLYVALLVPLALVVVGWVIVGAPRLFATVWDSLRQHGERVAAAVDATSWADAALGVLESCALALPCIAITFTLFRLTQLLAHAVARWTRGQTHRRVIAVAAVSVAALFVISSWWPDEDYEPLAANERGTVTEFVAEPQTVAVPAGQVVVGSNGATITSVSPETGVVVEQQESGQQETAEERHPVDEEPAEGQTEQTTTPTPSPASPESGEQAPTATAPAPAAPAPAQQQEPEQRVNQARAVNTTDGARVLELAFSIQRVRSGDKVDHVNFAQAIASCKACRTIAIAVQVILVMSDVDYAVPINYAESLNIACDACQTLALAWQLVVSTGGEVALTEQALARIAQIEAALAALEDSDAPITEIRAAADALLVQLKETVLGGLVPASGGSQQTTPAPTQSSSSDSSTASPQPTPEQSPAPHEPQPSATEEPTPEPTPEATPEPTPEATPEPSPEPTPEQTPEPLPSPTTTTTTPTTPTTTTTP